MSTRGVNGPVFSETATDAMPYNPPAPECPGGEIGRRKGLEVNLSTRLGNGRREWGQIRGTSPTARGFFACGACNPELSPRGAFLGFGYGPLKGKCRDLTAPA